MLESNHQNIMSYKSKAIILLTPVFLFIIFSIISPLLFTEPPQQFPKIKRINSPDKILFVGNSFTFYNEGVDVHLQRLANASSNMNTIEVSSVTGPGWNLAKHYSNPAFFNTLKSKNWDVVVLQGHSNEAIKQQKKADFEKYSTLLNEDIRNNGASTVFFMTWAYRFSPHMTNELRDSYVNMANSLDSFVVPVGLAWRNALAERPFLLMYSDLKHPTLLSTYLTACVFYAALFNRSPEGLPYFAQLKKQDALFLQRIAWETTEKFYNAEI